jgi:predicted transcriptional regulator
MKKTTEMAVRDFIRPAVVIKQDMEIGAALRTMREKGVEFLSVVDEHHKLIGCVNDVSFMRLVKQTPSAMSDPVWYDCIDSGTANLPVEKIMTANISTVSPEQSIDNAFKIMDSVGYKLLHVVDSEGKLLGVVTIREIFHKILGV